MTSDRTPGTADVAGAASVVGPYRRREGEAGNTLLLMPVAVLILLVLGGLAVDFALVFTRQREVADLTAGLANDAASAISEAAFFAGLPYELDAARARDVVALRMAHRAPDAFPITCPAGEVVIVDVDRVRVTCTAEVPLLFSRAVPGAMRTMSVNASSVARLQDGL